MICNYYSLTIYNAVALNSLNNKINDIEIAHSLYIVSHLLINRTSEL